MAESYAPAGESLRKNNGDAPPAPPKARRRSQEESPHVTIAPAAPPLGRSHKRAKRAKRGRPSKTRRVDGAPDARCTNTHPAAVARAADRASLQYMARLDLSRAQLEAANESYRQSRWSTPTGTLLPQNVSPPERPPPDALLEWAHAHVHHSGAKGAGRSFKVCDMLYADLRFNHWPYIETWLRFIADGRVELTFQDGIGFGLRARATFKVGERVVPGRVHLGGPRTFHRDRKNMARARPRYACAHPILTYPQASSTMTRWKRAIV